MRKSTKTAKPSWWKTGWMNVTPAIAEDMLTHNWNNYRVYRPGTIRTYAEEMKRGKWKANGESIIFGKSGRLQDGQNRLKAIILSGKIIRTSVVVDADDTDTYDIGLPRTTVQIARASNVIATAGMLAIAKMAIAGIGERYVGKQTIVDYAAEHFDDLKTAYKVVSSGGTTAKKAPCGIIAYGMLRAHEISENELTMFFRVVNTGNIVQCDKDPSPAFVLRRQLESISGSNGNIQKVQAELTYKALCDFRSNSSRRNNYTSDTNLAAKLVKQIMDLDNPQPEAA